MIGRTLGGATVATIQGVIVFFIAMIAGFRPASFMALPAVLLVIFLIALLFTAMGTAIASRMSDMHGFQLVMNFLVMPIFFLSGALFPLSGLPKNVLMVTKIDPLSYGVDALRGLLIGGAHYHLSISLIILSSITVFFLILGSVLFSKLEV